MENKIHEVKKGDNLIKISRKYKTSLDEIMKANRIANSHILWVGQQIVIPDTEATSNND